MVVAVAAAQNQALDVHNREDRSKKDADLTTDVNSVTQTKALDIICANKYESYIDKNHAAICYYITNSLLVFRP